MKNLITYCCVEYTSSCLGVELIHLVVIWLHIWMYIYLAHCHTHWGLFLVRIVFDVTIILILFFRTFTWRSLIQNGVICTKLDIHLYMTFFSTFTRRSLLQKGVMSTKLFVCVVLLCVFTFRVPFANIRYDFHIKRCWVRLYLQLCVEGLMFYLRYLCLFAHSGVQHILYWVFFV